MSDNQLNLLPPEERRPTAKVLKGRPLGPIGEPEPFTLRVQGQPPQPRLLAEEGQAPTTDQEPAGPDFAQGPPAMEANPCHYKPAEVAEYADQWRRRWPAYAARCARDSSYPPPEWHPVTQWREGWLGLAMMGLQWGELWRPPRARYNRRLAARHKRKVRARKEARK